MKHGGRSSATAKALVTRGRRRVGMIRRRLRSGSAVPLEEAAARAGWTLSGPSRRFLRAVDQALARSRTPRVVVLVGAEPSRLAGIIAVAHPHARVTPAPVGLGESALHALLAAEAPLDVIIDDAWPVRGTVRRFCSAFLHLRRGGVYVARRAHGERAPGRGTGRDDLWRFVSALLDERARRQRPPRPHGARDRYFLGRAVRSVVLEGRHLVIENGVEALAKLREPELDAVLEHRTSPTTDLLARLPPVEFASRCSFRSTAPERPRLFPERYDVPALSLRRYQDVVCAPGGLAVQGNLLLPDSFRHWQQPRLKHRFTLDVAPRFARVRGLPARPDRLAGAYFYLDSEYPAHYGHTTTEQMSRLWGWPRAKDAIPDLRAILSRVRGAMALTAYQREIFGAAGIDESDIVLIDAPVRVETLVAATPMFSMPFYVHPDIAGTWDTIGRALTKDAPDRERPARIFCSRRSAKRACSNRAAVQGLFERHGFAVVFPEDFPLAEQVRMFQEADVVAGFAGSGMFTLAYCEAPKRVVLLSSEAYVASNEYMISAVRGHRLDMVRSKPDPAPPGSRLERKPFNSGFTLDLDREGVRLVEILTAL